MFLREITHTINAFNDMGDIVRLYSKNPEAAKIDYPIFYQKKNPIRYSTVIEAMIQ